MKTVLSLAGQIYALGMMLVAGALVGILFDIYRLLRAFMRPGAWLTVLMDLAFWLLATPLVFGLLLIGNWGELRLFALLGLGCGLFAYFQIASPLVLWLLVALCRCWAAVCRVGADAASLMVGWPWRTAIAAGQHLSGAHGWARPQGFGRWRPRLLWRAGPRPPRSRPRWRRGAPPFRPPR
ncbi:MAG TPA: spore cortex biosynthesis protein YabQ [Limnochordia bacterium]